MFKINLCNTKPTQNLTRIRHLIEFVCSSNENGDSTDHDDKIEAIFAQLVDNHL